MMARDTSEVIRHLAAAGASVRPLGRPWTRTAIWCAVSLLYLWLLYIVWPHAAVPVDRLVLIEQAAALATGLAAATAAFATVVPGCARRFVWAPLAPLAVWVGTLGESCAREWSLAGHLPPLLMHWACLPTTIVAGIVPATAIVVMLRRGAPMTPRLTTAFAALAAAGLGNFGVRFLHPFDTSVAVLAWHVAAVFALSAAASVLGDRVFSWRRLIA